MGQTKFGWLRMPWHRRPAGGIRAAMVVAGAGALLTIGCIERTVTINTEPDGATVVLNDQEVGRSPVKVPFTWYGDYDIIVRKEGYQTLRTHQRITTPWYEYPGIDLFTECLMPFTVHDDRVLETYVLDPAQPPSKEALLDAAAEMKAQAVGETQ
jgi:hypothetical protein